MPGSFTDQRERSNEELKTKGRIERERQRGSKVKASSVLQNISEGMSSLWKRCVNLFFCGGEKTYVLCFYVHINTQVST